MRMLLLLLACIFLQSCASAVKERHLLEGRKYFADGYYKQAVHELLPLAVDGDPKAQYAVGYMYYYGYGVSQDNESGLFWMHKAADQHYEPAVKALRML